MSDFWRGYRAALDDVERGARAENWPEWLASVRAKFQLEPAPEVPDRPKTDISAQALKLLMDTGLTEDKAKELLTLAARAGREAGEVTRSDP